VIINTRVMERHADRVLVVVVAAMVALSALVVALAATRSPAQLDPRSPEGTVQAYLRAVLDGDHEAAVRYLDPASGCDIGDLDRTGRVQPTRVALTSTHVDGSSARVRVELTTGAGDGPFGSGYQETTTFRLTRSSTGWLLTGSPWPLFDCAGGL
jgi:hypothetical protein